MLVAMLEICLFCTIILSSSSTIFTFDNALLRRYSPRVFAYDFLKRSSIIFSSSSVTLNCNILLRFFFEAVFSSRFSSTFPASSNAKSSIFLSIKCSVSSVFLFKFQGVLGEVFPLTSRRVLCSNLRFVIQNTVLATLLLFFIIYAECAVFLKSK